MTIAMRGPQLLEELGKKPLFTAREARSLLGGGPAHTNLLLHRLVSSGRLFRIEKGMYSVHDDPFLVASRIAWPSYLSFWSALRYHGLTEQVPQAIWVVTSKRRKRLRLRFCGTDILFTVTSERNLFGYEKKEFGGFEIFVADPEKAIVDCLLFGKVSAAEIHEVLEKNRGRFRPGRLVDYAARTGNRALARRLGLMLERLGQDFSGRLAGKVYPQPVLLDPRSPPKGRLNAKWKVIENVVL